jgi:hypothetical protein
MVRARLVVEPGQYRRDEPCDVPVTLGVVFMAYRREIGSPSHDRIGEEGVGVDRVFSPLERVDTDPFALRNVELVREFRPVEIDPDDVLESVFGKAAEEVSWGRAVWMDIAEPQAGFGPLDAPVLQEGGQSLWLLIGDVTTTIEDLGRKRHRPVEVIRVPSNGRLDVVRRRTHHDNSVHPTCALTAEVVLVAE